MANRLQKALFFSSLLLLGAPTNAWAQEEDISVIVNGKSVKFDVPPQPLHDITVIPARTMFESLGAKGIPKFLLVSIIVLLMS